MAGANLFKKFQDNLEASKESRIESLRNKLNRLFRNKLNMNMIKDNLHGMPTKEDDYKVALRNIGISRYEVGNHENSLGRILRK